MNNLLETMKKKYSLTIEDNMILIEPEEWGFTTFPIKNPETAMRVTAEEYFGLMMDEYTIDLENRKVILRLEEEKI